MDEPSILIVWKIAADIPEVVSAQMCFIPTTYIFLIAKYTHLVI